MNQQGLTNKEAIERLKCMRLFMQINDRDSTNKFLDEDYVANEMAVEALEKQIPKKPIRVPVGHNGSSTDGCPVCKTEFYEKHDFCPTCGNKMDWSDND